MSLRLRHLSSCGPRLIRGLADVPTCYAILRVQSRRSRTASFSRQHRNVETLTDEGMGLQLFGRGGKSVFVTTDQLVEESLDGLLEQALRLLAAHPEVPGLLEADLHCLPLTRATRLLEGESLVQRQTAQEQLALVEEVHTDFREVRTPHARSSASIFSAVDDEWRIFRSDGSDIHFNTFRTVFTHRVTMTHGRHSLTVRDTECGQDERYLVHPEDRARLRRRVGRRLQVGEAVLAGEPLEAGHYNLILDAGMAKGLAHEAFGHASETDRVLEGSVLRQDGRYRLGALLARDDLSIVDEPLVGDWADQPFSANGVPRQRVAILDHGRLVAGLADHFSGPAVGLPPTGSERAERYDCIPMPRMTNIRLELHSARPWEATFGLFTQEELFQALLERNMISPEETWLYLEGYRGGQVNPNTGDYVFNCTAIHRYQAGTITTHPPAVFSGRILETLAAVCGALGPLELHRQGMCGKEGQNVPSSGGGHLVTLLRACDGVTIGGH